MSEINPRVPHALGPRRSPLAFVAATLLVLMLTYMLLFSPNFQAAIPGGDYLQFYVAARLVRAGLQERLYDFALQDQLQHDPAAMPFPPDRNMVGLYIYPPFFIWFCLPFSYLSFKAGAMAWVIVMAACFIGSLLVLRDSMGSHRHALGLSLLGGLLFPPTLTALMSCQNATLSLLILAATYSLFRVGKDLAAGMVFALLAFKPQLTLVIALAMLCKGRWRFMLGGMLAGSVLVAASLMISPAASADYLRLGPILSRWIDMPGMPLDGMSCWLGFWRLLLAGRPLGDAQVAATISSLVTLVPVAWAMRGRLEPTGEKFPLQFAALVVATILISPHLLSYDLAILLLPFVLIAGTHHIRVQGGVRDRLWPHLTLAVYAGAAISKAVASRTGFQLIVPLLFAYLVMIAGVSRHRFSIGDRDHRNQDGSAHDVEQAQIDDP